jgi:cyanophycinase
MPNRGPLVLVGGTSWGAEPLKRLLPVGSIVALPTAAAFEHWQDTVTEQAKQWNVALDTVPLLARHDADEPNTVAKLRAAAAIVLVGESSLHARASLAGSEAWEAVMSAWKSGAALIGVGGGAAVLGDPMVDPRGGAFTLGLGVMNKVAVLPHADEWGPDRSRRTLKMAAGKHTLISINSAAAAMWTYEGGWTADGTVSVAGATLAELPTPVS